MTIDRRPFHRHAAPGVRIRRLVPLVFLALASIAGPALAQPRSIVTAWDPDGSIHASSGDTALRLRESAVRLQVGTVIVMAADLLRVSHHGADVPLGDGTDFGELTAIGVFRVAQKTGTFVFDYEFEPVGAADWEAAGVDPPLSDGTLFRVFDDPSRDLGRFQRPAEDQNAAQNGELLVEIGFSGANRVPAPGERFGTSRATGDWPNNGGRSFEPQLDLQLAVLTRGSGLAGLDLLPERPSSSVRASGSGVLFLRGGPSRNWFDQGALSISLRPRRVVAEMSRCFGSGEPGEALRLVVTGLAPGTIAANSIRFGNGATTHPSLMIAADGRLATSLTLPRLAVGDHAITIGSVQLSERYTVTALSDPPPVSWQPFADGITAQRVLGLAVHPDDRKQIVMLLPGALHRTDDGGETWSEVSDAGLPRRLWSEWGHIASNDLESAGASDPDRLYLVNGGAVYRSDDFGRSWRWAGGEGTRSIGAPSDDGASCAADIAGVVADESSGTVRAGTITSGHCGGVLASENAGDSWRLEGGSCAALCDPRPLSAKQTRSAEDPGNDYWPIGVDHADPQIVLAAKMPYAGLRRSTNGGADWRLVPDFTDRRVSGLAQDPRDARRWSAVADGTVWHSTDRGETWNRDETSPTAVFVSFDDGGRLWAYGGSAFAYKRRRDWKTVASPTLDGASQWVRSIDVDVSWLGCRRLTVGTYGGGVFRKGLGRWRRLSGGVPSAFVIAQLERLGATDRALAAVGGAGLYERHPGDERWLPLGPAHPGVGQKFDVERDTDSVLLRTLDLDAGLQVWTPGDADWQTLDVGEDDEGNPRNPKAAAFVPGGAAVGFVAGDELCRAPLSGAAAECGRPTGCAFEHPRNNEVVVDRSRPDRFVVTGSGGVCAGSSIGSTNPLVPFPAAGLTTGAAQESAGRALLSFQPGGGRGTLHEYDFESERLTEVTPFCAVDTGEVVAAHVSDHREAEDGSNAIAWVALDFLGLGSAERRSAVAYRRGDGAWRTVDISGFPDQNDLSYVTIWDEDHLLIATYGGKIFLARLPD